MAENNQLENSNAGQIDLLPWQKAAHDSSRTMITLSAEGLKF